MQERAGSVEFRKISQPKGDPALYGFSCGDGKHDKPVNDLVANQHRGRAKYSPIIMVMEHGSQTSGVCAWRPRPLPPAPDQGQPGDDIYIHLIGISRDYRRKGLGSVLLSEALRQIKAETADGSMPAVWAYISPFNKKSHELFAAHDFSTRAPEKGDMVRLRPSGLELLSPVVVEVG
jgi:GNAT superfamily N-acetyltransferase